MKELSCAIGAGSIEKTYRPVIPKEIAYAECSKCSYARTGDFCVISDGTCLRSVMQAISRCQQRYKSATGKIIYAAFFVVLRHY